MDITQDVNLLKRIYGKIPMLFLKEYPLILSTTFLLFPVFLKILSMIMWLLMKPVRWTWLPAIWLYPVQKMQWLLVIENSCPTLSPMNKKKNLSKYYQNIRFRTDIIITNTVCSNPSLWLFPTWRNLVARTLPVSSKDYSIL